MKIGKVHYLQFVEFNWRVINSIEFQPVYSLLNNVTMLHKMVSFDAVPARRKILKSLRSGSCLLYGKLTYLKEQKLTQFFFF
jgi:hypothetical protein